MLDDNELTIAINSFLTRKQKQFPDLDLNRNAESLNLELISPNQFEVPEKKLTSSKLYRQLDSG